MNLEKTIREAISKVLKIPAENVTSDKHLVNDLNIDSFNIMEIEHALSPYGFGDIELEAFQEIQTVGDLFHLLKKQKT